MTRVCPKTKLRCLTVEVCWLIYCAKGGIKARPMPEHELTTAEKYRLAMSERTP